MARVQDFLAFTIKYNGIANRITTEVKLTEAFDSANPPVPPPTPISKIALWDTGATKSVITASTAAALGLTSIGPTQVNHVGGSHQSKTYLVNVYLPNGVTIQGVRVTECPDKDFDVIIGMDIIAHGDFTITNAGGQTWASFRIPSVKRVDYVDEANAIKIRWNKTESTLPMWPQGRERQAHKIQTLPRHLATHN